MAAEILRGDRRLLETFPHKELQDYWSTRPRYEDSTSGGYVPANSTPGGSGSCSANPLAVEGNPNEPPPPPYTLEGGSPSPTHDGFLTAPTTPDNQQNYNVSDLASDLGRHTIGGPSTYPPSHPPGGFDSQPSPLFHTIPVPQVSYESDSHPQSVNFDTPFHWNDDYPNPQSQPPGGYNAGTPTNPWDPPASTRPQEAPFQQGYQPGYASPRPRPPIHTATKPILPSQSPHQGTGALNSSASLNRPGGSPSNGYKPPYLPPQSTYPGKVGPGSYYGYDQKMDGWGGPPPPNPSYPGRPTSGQGTAPHPGSGHTKQSPYPGQTHNGPPPLSSTPPLPQGYGRHQSPSPGVDRPPPSYPAKTHIGPPPVSNSPPLSQGPGGYGQHQSSYPGMSSSPVPVLPERPPTRPPTSQGYGSSYPGMTNSPAPPPDRPPTSHSSRPTPPPQVQPPLPGGYDYSGPTQLPYGGVNSSASSSTYQQMGPDSHGHQQPQPTHPRYNPPSPSTSPRPGYPGSHQRPPPPPRKCDMCRRFHLCFVELKFL